MEPESSPRRRDVLRAGATAGLLGVGGFAFGGVSAQDEQARNAFSFSLQEGDQFRVQFQPNDPQGNPATQTIPGTCLENGGAPEFRILIVRAYRGNIDLGYRDLFVPEQVIATQTTTTTTPESDTTTPESDTTTPESDTTTPENATTTPSEETTTLDDETTTTTPENATATPENVTTTPKNVTTTPDRGTTTEAAFQDETTTETETTNETTTEIEPTTTTISENATTTVGNETTTSAEETTTPAEETTTTEETTTETQAELPEIQIGEWYRITSSARCENLYVVTLEPTEPPETATAEAGNETTTQ